jgi:hypothetical protein
MKRRRAGSEVREEAKKSDQPQERGDRTAHHMRRSRRREPSAEESDEVSQTRKRGRR